MLSQDSIASNDGLLQDSSHQEIDCKALLLINLVKFYASSQEEPMAKHEQTHSKASTGPIVNEESTTGLVTAVLSASLIADHNKNKSLENIVDITYQQPQLFN